jgi:hypothetical protein
MTAKGRRQSCCNYWGQCLPQLFKTTLYLDQSAFRGPNLKPPQYSLSNGPNLLSNIYLESSLAPHFQFD